ncbi:MAG: hypothetical protein IJM26_04065 [Lachnospiraceae bacterium]|nr:hypothetical protein [Lachnospiraceae bacterium]
MKRPRAGSEKRSELASRYEEYFISSFVKKSRRKRLSFELQTPGKRYEGISRFCHQSEEFLDPAFIRMQGVDLLNQPGFEEFRRGREDLCLLLTPAFWQDEIFLPFEEALEMAANELDAVVLIAASFAMVFSEVGREGREKYLLQRDGQSDM